MNAPNPAIETRQLRKSFGGVNALLPLDLTIPHGSIFALVGPNGAGKTTLLKLLMNIVQPSSGSASVLGDPTTRLTGRAFARIGYVSENQEMPEWMTVGGLMEFLRPFYPTWSSDYASQLLHEMKLPSDRKLKQLSRGMRMKVALASVLAFRPPLILMDEPFSGLDPIVRDELIEALLSLSAEQYDGQAGTTILISSHDLAEVETFASHVGFLNEGHLLFAESMESLTTRFREVTVTLQRSELSVKAQRALPESWLLPEQTHSIFRFVHSKASSEDIRNQIASVFPDAAHVESIAMSLRSIFLSLTKANSLKHAGDGRSA